MFDITPVALLVALAGGAYLLLVAPKLLTGHGPSTGDTEARDPVAEASHAQTGSVGDPSLFAQPRPLDLRKGLISLAVFITVVAVAALGYAPIAAAAFTGAVGLILMRVISADEAYKGLRPEILLLIAGMVVVGLSLEVSGLATAATNGLIAAVEGLHPLVALALLYGVTLFATEVLSNAAVAVLATPLAVALAESLAVSPEPFLIAIMLAASAAFATPFGYQTNVLVYEMGRYSYLDFLRVGLPLNLITWGAGMLAIPAFFPF